MLQTACMRLQGFFVGVPAVGCDFFGSWQSKESLQWLPSHCMGGPLHDESLGRLLVQKDEGQLMAALHVVAMPDALVATLEVA